MKKILLLMLFIALSFCGCGGDDAPPVGSISNVTFTQPVTRLCDVYVFRQFGHLELKSKPQYVPWQLPSCSFVSSVSTFSDPISFRNNLDSRPSVNIVCRFSLIRTRRT